MHAEPSLNKFKVTILVFEAFTTCCGCGALQGEYACVSIIYLLSYKVCEIKERTFMQKMISRVVSDLFFNCHT